MSEPSPASQYIIAEQPEPRVHHCPRCGEIIGTEIERDGHPYLLIGDHPASFFVGLCGECGHEVIWEANWRRLEGIIKRQIKARERVKRETADILTDVKKASGS